MSRRAQKSSWVERRNCTKRSLTESARSWFSLKRLETPTISIAAPMIGLELLGQVVLEPAEQPEREEHQPDGDGEHDPEVPQIPPGGSIRKNRRLHTADGNGRLAVDRTLEGDDDRGHRVQEKQRERGVQT